MCIRARDGGRPSSAVGRFAATPRLLGCHLQMQRQFLFEIAIVTTRRHDRADALQPFAKRRRDTCTGNHG
jgi:hypothetical protein